MILKHLAWIFLRYLDPGFGSHGIHHQKMHHHHLGPNMLTGSLFPSASSRVANPRTGGSIYKIFRDFCSSSENSQDCHRDSCRRLGLPRLLLKFLPLEQSLGEKYKRWANQDKSDRLHPPKTNSLPLKNDGKGRQSFSVWECKVSGAMLNFAGVPLSP